MKVLGIDVDEELVEAWRSWLMPSRQPFRVDRLPPRLATQLSVAAAEEPSLEVLDSFSMYTGRWVWLTEPEYLVLPAELRTALRQSRSPKLAWPSKPRSEQVLAVLSFVNHGVTASEHRRIPERVWRRAADMLPMARQLAGSFPRSSGPNCFGTVMGAAGVDGAASSWVEREPFEKWLAQRTNALKPGTANDQRPGVVLVWRRGDGLVDHAAVTLGEGWALNKPSQAWCSPRVVWTVRRTILHSRYRGNRLSRYALAGPMRA